MSDYITKYASRFWADKFNRIWVKLFIGVQFASLTALEVLITTYLVLGDISVVVIALNVGASVVFFWLAYSSFRAAYRDYWTTP